MARKHSLLVLFAIAGSATIAQASPSASKVIPAQYTGFWKISVNEDPIPPDTVEIRPDGTFILQGIKCAAHVEGTIHEFNGELFVRLVIPGKGPVSFIYKPDGRGNLVFTSSRTRQNATYSKLDANPCP